MKIFRSFISTSNYTCIRYIIVCSNCTFLGVISKMSLEAEFPKLSAILGTSSHLLYKTVCLLCSIHTYIVNVCIVSPAAGIGFNASSYYITVDANYTINQTVLATMRNFLNYDDTFILKAMTFYYISDIRFYLDPITGDIKVKRHLDPLRLHYARVYLRYNGTINTTNRFYASTTSTLVRIYTRG